MVVLWVWFDLFVVFDSVGLFISFVDMRLKFVVFIVYCWFVVWWLLFWFLIQMIWVWSCLIVCRFIGLLLWLVLFCWLVVYSLFYCFCLFWFGLFTLIRLVLGRWLLCLWRWFGGCLFGLRCVFVVSICDFVCFGLMGVCGLIIVF